LPAGTSLETTDAASKPVERILAGQPEIKSYQVTIGGGGGLFGFGGGGTNKATFRITTKGGGDQQGLIDSLRGQTKTLEGKFLVGAAGGGVGSSDIAVDIKASDERVLREATEQVRAAVAELPGVTDVRTDLAANTQQVQVTLDRPAAARLGLTDAA